MQYRFDRSRPWPLYDADAELEADEFFRVRAVRSPFALTVRL